MSGLSENFKKGISEKINYIDKSKKTADFNSFEEIQANRFKVHSIIVHSLVSRLNSQGLLQ